MACTYGMDLRMYFDVLKDVLMGCTFENMGMYLGMYFDVLKDVLGVIDVLMGCTYVVGCT